jgi:hypothetical protein
LLMFLAFTIDQIQQRCCRFFRTLHQGLRTKVKLWASIRHLFNVLVFKSIEALYRHMAWLLSIVFRLNEFSVLRIADFIRLC